MKRILLSLVAGIIVFCFSGCLKEDHSVRMRNQYHEGIQNVRVGDAYIGSVPAFTTSDYESITTGNFKISGTSDSGLPLSGSGTVSGKGKHKWTITLSSDGTIAIAEDK